MKNFVNEKPTRIKNYWRSLDDLADTPAFQEFVKKEFPNHSDEILRGPSRRHFMKVMAASFCLAGLTSCNWPREKIVPYSRRPDYRIPGVPEQYATVFELGGIATGLLVTSFDGRPVKIEGNPDHPYSRGGATALAQASILELYDPDRSRYPFKRNGLETNLRTMDEVNLFIKNHFAGLKPQQGKGICILSESNSSLCVDSLRARFSQQFPQAKWCEFEPIHNDNEKVGTEIIYGVPLRVHPDFQKAKVILSLESDFLYNHPTSVKNAREFTEQRNPELDKINRLYAVESNYTITGAMADHRLPLESSKIESLLCAIAAELTANHSLESARDYAQVFTKFQTHSFDPQWIKAVASDLASHQGQSLIMAGSNQPPLVHALVAFLNKILGNENITIRYSDEKKEAGLQSLQDLARSIQLGEVQTLVILGGNPVYDAPADIEMGKLIEQVDVSIHLSLYRNETTERCNWHIPRAHFLESWGDSRAYDGTVSIMQPLIFPLYDGKTIIELLALMNGEETTRGYDIVRQTFQERLSSEFSETNWNQWLHDGIVPNTQYAWSRVLFRDSELIRQLNNIPADRQFDLEITFIPDSSVYDGRFANNAWLQEAPDFITKLTWDNAALINPNTAARLNIKHGDLIRIRSGESSITIVAYHQPGQAPQTITLPIGYGRTHAGRVGNGVGVNVNTLRTVQTFHRILDAVVEPLHEPYVLACTQDHHAIDKVGFEERDRRIHELIHETNIDDYRHDPEIFHRHSHIPDATLWEPHEYPTNKWGMTIDLNKCIGCNACVIACQSENNVPVVGKEQVSLSREMHWIRIDRYFSGDIENPKVTHQPLACVHCENAPCEQVCPVNATVHSSEGLNVMVYNRCVGTRYCSNNCPFKVRRFNYFYWHKDLQEPQKMVFNPEVTVRSRGVMEKCTYCVQRIEKVKIQAKNERRPIEDGEIVPACAQTCPTQAIVFGDLSKENSTVAKLRRDHRAYSMLGELFVKPRTAYLARLRNPNPELVKEDEHSNHNQYHHS